MTSSPATEIALLGMMLSSPRAIDDAAALDLSDLSLDSHRTIFTQIRKMHADGQEVNIVSLSEELRRLNRDKEVGGAAYIVGLTDDAHHAKDVKGYIKIIKDTAARRNIVSLCEVMSSRALDGEEPDEILHDLQSYAVAEQAAHVQVRPSHIAEFVLPTWDSMKRQMEHTGEVLGIPTGLASLDRSTTGWREGELTYVGALPSRGKTSFMLQCMLHAASNGFGVGCISLEMRAVQLMRRLATIRSRIAALKFRDPRTMNEQEREHTKQTLYALGELPIWINDQSGLKPSAIASLARQMHAKGARVIFVDFVQIIHEDGKDRREAINRISAALRDLAKSLEIPFVVASQLARKQGDIENPPTLRDLKESGNLEQDAHNVIMLHRPKLNGDWTGDDEIIVEKQREGNTGPLSVYYDEKALIFRERFAGSRKI
jgi:replicative DNA helicase